MTVELKTPKILSNNKPITGKRSCKTFKPIIHTEPNKQSPNFCCWIQKENVKYFQFWKGFFFLLAYCIIVSLMHILPDCVLRTNKSWISLSVVKMYITSARGLFMFFFTHYFVFLKSHTKWGWFCQIQHDNENVMHLINGWCGVVFFYNIDNFKMQKK